MKKYMVGGFVRDTLMNLSPKDIDYVVVGETRESMVASGFNPVGAHFPVFLDNNGVEHALAREEVSTGDSYQEFSFVTDNVTIESDLSRRDLTINAIAFGNEEIVDPFNGRQDIKDKILRHVSDAFAEDPLRIFRLARFAAKFEDFSIAPETLEFCRDMVLRRMHLTISPERVANEMIRALETNKPSRFFSVLLDVGALRDWFPEVYSLIGKTQPEKWHAEGDSFVHTMMVLDSAASEGETTLNRFGALVHDLGKGTTPMSLLPKHHGHEKRGVPLVDSMCDRLKLSTEMRETGKKVAEFHTHIHNLEVLNPKTIVKMLSGMSREVIHSVSTVARHDGLGKIPKIASDKREICLKLWDAVHSVKARNIFSVSEIEEISRNKKFGKIKEAIFKLQVREVYRITNR